MNFCPYPCDSFPIDLGVDLGPIRREIEECKRRYHREMWDIICRNVVDPDFRHSWMEDEAEIPLGQQTEIEQENQPQADNQQETTPENESNFRQIIDNRSNNHTRKQQLAAASKKTVKKLPTKNRTKLPNTRPASGKYQQATSSDSTSSTSTSRHHYHQRQFVPLLCGNWPVKQGKTGSESKTNFASERKISKSKQLERSETNTTSSMYMS